MKQTPIEYSDYRARNTSTNILNEDEGPITKSPISRAKSTQPQGKVRVVPYVASKKKASDDAMPTPKETRYKTPLTSQGKVRVVPDKTITPAPKAAAPTPTPTSKVTASTPKPIRETAASKASRQAAYDEWKSSNAEPTAKLAQETASKVGYQGFRKGGNIDGIAAKGKTKGRYI